MDLRDARDSRRSVRSSTDQPVEKPVVDALMQAAVQAPSALNQQPGAVAVIQDGKRRAQYSDHVTAQGLKTLKPQAPRSSHRETLANPESTVFYGAATVIIVCAKPEGVHAEEACSLAAQNLMLAAQAMGSGTCPIEFARPWLNLARTTRARAIPRTTRWCFLSSPAIRRAIRCRVPEESRKAWCGGDRPVGRITAV